MNFAKDRPTLEYDSNARATHGESKFIRRLPWILAVANATVALPLLIFDIVANVKGVRLGDKIDGPLLLLALLDFPASLVPSAWMALIGDCSKFLRDSEIASLSVYCVFVLITGFCWYYCIGRTLRALIRHIRRVRRSGRPDPM